MGDVVSIFDRKRKSEAENTKAETKKDFDEIARKNKENKERLRKERSQANSSVLKSYKIK